MNPGIILTQYGHFCESHGKKNSNVNKRAYMYCNGTIKELKCGYFGIQVVFITPRPSLLTSAAPLEINLGSGQWKLPISLITIL